MMSRPIFHFLLIIGLLGNHVFAGEMRTWTDISGREIEAEMTSFANGEVGFKLKDSGKEIRFPFARLSEEDRGYVRENAPVNLKTAARQIDQMVWDRLKVANSDIKTGRRCVGCKQRYRRRHPKQGIGAACSHGEDDASDETAH